MIAKWVPCTEEDLLWLDNMLKMEYFSYEEGVEGDILREKVRERMIRMKRTKLAEEVK